MRTPLAFRVPGARRTLATSAGASIAGSVAYHRAYILLHTHVPPPAFPARVPSALQRELQVRTARWGGLVNHAWLPSTAPPAPGAAPEWDNADTEAYALSAYAPGRPRLDVPRVARKDLDAVAEALRAHAEASPERVRGPLELYVCTHAARDCRCGTTGQAVFEALCAEVARRGLEGDVRVGAVGHVGGHKYAANVLVFPWGEWLGNVMPEDVPALVDKLQRAHSEAAFDYREFVPLLPENMWRGRMGLDKEEQLALVGQGEVHTPDAPLTPHASRS